MSHQPTPVQLRTGRVLLGALAAVVDRAPVLAKALLVPVALSVGIATLPLFIPAEEIQPITSLILSIVSLVLHTWMAITTHRIILLGSDAVPEWGLFKWTQRESRFLLFLLAMFGGMLLAGIVLIAIPVLGLLLFMAMACVGLASLSLVFPAIAMDEPTSFTSAWALAQGNILALVLCVSVVPMVLGVLVFLLAIYVPPLGALLQGLVAVLTVTILSVAYLELTRRVTPRSSGPPAVS